MKFYIFLFSATKSTDYDWFILPEFIIPTRRFDLARDIGFHPGNSEIHEKIILYEWPIHLLVYWRAAHCKDTNQNIILDNFGRKLWRFYGVIFKSYVTHFEKLSKNQIYLLLNHSETEIERKLYNNTDSKYPLGSTFFEYTK